MLGRAQLTRRATLRRALSQAAAAAPAKEAPPHADYTAFQKACAAVAAVGATGAAALAYTVSRVTSDREFRLWLHRDVRFVASYVEEFMEEHMPQTVKAIRIEEETMDAAAAPPEPIVISSSINLGAAPAVPRITDTGKRFFGRLEQEAGADAVALAAPTPAPAPVPGVSAIGLQMPTQPQKVYRTAGELHVDLPEDAAPMVPDEDESDDAPNMFSPNALSAATPVEACAAGVPPELAVRMVVPAHQAGRFEGRLARYRALQTLLRDGGGGGISLEEAAAAEVAATLAAKGGGDSVGGGRGGAEATRLIELPDAFRDGLFGTAASEGGAAAAAMARGPHAPAGMSLVRELRLQWLRVQEAYAEAEEAALAGARRDVERHARRHGGGGATLQRIVERQRKLAHTRRVLVAEKADVKRAPLTSFAPIVPDPFPLQGVAGGAMFAGRPGLDIAT